ncbi:MAG TPA: DsbA family protein, partial [Myxococcales bacterium]|nr:DsbA family protein [Myxococcales bacterium]
VWRSLPLAFHTNAAAAAEAALAAGAQGKFWEMHDLLLEHQQELSSGSYVEWARLLGLDVERFQADLASHRYRPRVAADEADAKLLGATGTPTFFVDGRRVLGAQPIETFEKAVTPELGRAALLLRQGVRASALYATELALNQRELTQQEATAVRAPSRRAGAEAMNVALGDGYARGPADAKVTIVEFSDYQCPFCARVEPTVARLLAAHPRDVRLVWRDDPLPFHANAEGAAEAALAAGAQGKYWEMHDRLFQGQRELGPESYARWATELGLDAAAFQADLASHRYRERVRRDAAYAASIGAEGVPTFFVDGRRVVGAEPFDVFETVVEEEVAHAEALLRRGTPPRELYEALVAANVLAHPRLPARPTAGTADSGERLQVVIGDAPTRGPASAPVTLVEFAEFQCPFCGRVEPTLRRLRALYGDQIRLVWKNQPLPFHPNALPAAQAAVAAGLQGRFWEMHDRMFDHQQDLGEASYRAWAVELGLDLARFDRDRASPEVEATIERDEAEGKALGAGGTPTFFVNGRLLLGAQPIERFEALIDEELGGRRAAQR